jgi:hypothetical protein
MTLGLRIQTLPMPRQNMRTREGILMCLTRTGKLFLCV